MLKNIVFDIGNVLVRWSPYNIMATVFNNESDLTGLAQKFFKSSIFYDLNLGKVTEEEAISLYSRELDLPHHIVKKIFTVGKESLTPLEGSFELLEDAYQAGIPLYSITDNVREIVTHLKERYSFFDKFKGAVISAEVGILKPSARIFHRLIDTYSLVPEETVFIDDVQANVEGAEKVGMKGIQFTDAANCRQELISLGFTQLVK
jgi:putative hydrolase of the HAD superfamily